MKKLYYLLTVLFLCTAFVLSNPNCPTGKTGAPSASTGSSSNCTSCHGGNSLNAAGGGIVVSGLPTTYTAGTAYSFSVKINHASANRTVWGFAIKAIDTVARVVVGTWSTSNANTSIKGTAGGTSYELSHAHAGTSASANTYTYSNLTWTAPAVPTANQARVKFYIAAVAGDGSGDESGDFVYTTTFTSNQQVAPPPPPACVFTYGTWSTCSNGVQTRAYSTSPAGCTGVPPADSIQRTCTVSLPTAQVITQSVIPGVCDTLRTFSVPSQTDVNYAWSISGTGNTIISGQNTNSITASTKVAGSVYVTLSNSVGSIPTVSSAFTRALPPAPNTLLGSTLPCAGGTFTYQTASATPTASQVAVNHYSWTVPTGATIISGTTDSSTVNISFGSTFTTGTIAVKSVSACNITSAAKSVAVAPAKPLDLVSSTGFWNACIGSSVTYYVVSALVNTGTVYRWTKPLGTQITNANADSSIVTLNFITGYKGGALTVKSATSCGTLGTVLSKTLTHLNCGATGRVGIEELQEDLVNIYPNPNNGTFTLNVQTDRADTIHIAVMDVHGRIVYRDNVRSLNGIMNKKYNMNLQSGLYMLYYTTNLKTKTIKFIVQ